MNYTTTFLNIFLFNHTFLNPNILNPGCFIYYFKAIPDE